MKRFIMGLIVGVAISVCGAAYAEDGLQKVEAYLRPDLPIKLNGQNITLDNSPLMYDGSTYLRLRDIAKISGVDVVWNESTQTVELSTYGTQQIPVTTTPTPTTTSGGAAVSGTTDNTAQIQSIQQEIQDKKSYILVEENTIRVQQSLIQRPGMTDDFIQSGNKAIQQSQTNIDNAQKRIADLEAQLAQLQSQ